MYKALHGLVGKHMRFQENDKPEHPLTEDDERLSTELIIVSDTTRKGHRVLVASPIAIFLMRGECSVMTRGTGTIHPLPEHTSVIKFPTLVEQSNGMWKMFAEEEDRTHTFTGTLARIS